jgi:type I restriction enzyme, S subunit
MAWSEKMLGEICDEGGGVIKTGPFGSQLHQSDYSQAGTPVVMPKDIVGGRVTSESVARVSHGHVERLSHHQMEVGDIVYGRRGDIGRCALITESERGWLCGTGCLRIHLGEGKVDPAFLFYFLNHPHTVEWICNQAVGATMPNLNTAILRSVPIRYPDKNTQRRIASILSAYDDLIENNTRRIEILEEMARRLYEEWFVHFRFPGYEKVRFRETEHGLVPEGWSVGTLGKFIELAYGKALKAADRVEGPYPVYGSSGVVGYHQSYLVAAPGVIVGRKGNVGSVYWTDTHFYPIDTVYYVKTELPLEYVYFNLQRQNFINNDAAVPGLNRNQAYSLPLVCPTETVLRSFADHCAPVFRMVRLMMLKNVNLRAQRDLLLPKLISGEIDVSEAEAETEAA